MYTGPDPFNRIGEESRQQEDEQKREKVRRDFNTPLPLWYIVVSITIVLLIILGVVLVYRFHVY